MTLCNRFTGGILTAEDSGSLPSMPYNIAAIPFTYSYSIITQYIIVITTLNNYLLDKLRTSKLKYFIWLFFFLWWFSFLSVDLSFLVYVIFLLSEECFCHLLKSRSSVGKCSQFLFVWESISPSLLKDNCAECRYLDWCVLLSSL